MYHLMSAALSRTRRIRRCIYPRPRRNIGLRRQILVQLADVDVVDEASKTLINLRICIQPLRRLEVALVDDGAAQAADERVVFERYAYVIVIITV